MVQVESTIEKGSLTALFQANTLLETLDASPDLDLTTQKTSVLNLKRHNLTINDMADKVGLMETNSTATSQKQISQKDDKKKQNLVMTDFLIRLEAARQSAQDMHNLIDMRLEQINTDIKEAQAARDTLQDKSDIISNALETYEKTGQFELNEDGTFKNEVLETAIQEYEAEHGEINRDNTALLGHILTEKLDEYKDDIAAKTQDIEQLERDKRYFEEADRKLESAENKMNSDDPNLQQQGIDEIDALDRTLKLETTVDKDIEVQSQAELDTLNENLTSQIGVISAPKF